MAAIDKVKQARGLASLSPSHPHPRGPTEPAPRGAARTEFRELRTLLAELRGPDDGLAAGHRRAKLSRRSSGGQPSSRTRSRRPKRSAAVETRSGPRMDQAGPTRRSSSTGSAIGLKNHLRRLNGPRTGAS